MVLLGEGRLDIAFCLRMLLHQVCVFERICKWKAGAEEYGKSRLQLI